MSPDDQLRRENDGLRQELVEARRALSEATAQHAGALRRSEELFERAFRMSPIAIAITDVPDGRFIDVNDALLSLFGHTREELIGRTTADISLWADRAQRERVMGTMIDTGATRNVHARFRRKDGELRDVILSTELTDVRDGRCALTVVVDDTEQRRAEAALLESQYLLEQAQEIAHVGSWFVELAPNERLLWSKEHYRIVGIPEGTPITVALFLQHVHDDDRERVIAAMRAVDASDVPLSLEYRFERPDGDVRWVYARAKTERRPDGTAIRLIGVVHDITERRHMLEQLSESERRYRRIIEGTSEGIGMLDSAGRIAFANGRLADMLGFRGDELLGQPMSEFIQPEDRDRFREGYARRVAGVVETYELRLRKSDGSDLVGSVTASPLFDEQGRFDASLGFVRDIGEQRRAEVERRKAEAALRRTEDQLRQAHKMEAIGALAGGVAHDFNNLLSVIISYTTLILADLPAGHPIRPDLEDVAKAGERATELTQQLLVLSRKQMLEPRVLDLNQSIESLKRILARTVREDIELSFVTSGSLGNVFADPGQIEQIVMNLVVNARDAMSAGGKLVIETADVELGPAYASTHHGVEPGPYVMLSVSDTGVGMDPATRERIFEPFFTTKEKGKGTGLGLATVFGIVQQSGGHIVVESEPGQGTTFKVFFPRSDRAQDAAVAVKASASSMLRGTETILVVEDEEQVRRMTEAILRRQGYTVLGAASGGDALVISEQHESLIDLLLTDVVMPRMNGRQLAQRIAEVRPETKVLFVSGYAESLDVEHGTSRRHLQKPITPDALARKVREVLDGI
ncbi:MAG: Blue-light-activated protein [Labilithrix sp.]|nr:Blue-light-activated protein [Labilithrix sp.]